MWLMLYKPRWQQSILLLMTARNRRLASRCKSPLGSNVREIGKKGCARCCYHLKATVMF